MVALSPLHKADLRCLRKLSGRSRVTYLGMLYDSGFDIGLAVAEACKGGVDVTSVVEKLWLDHAIPFTFGYRDGWVLECYPTESCAIPLRQKDLQTKQASSMFDHYVWHSTGTM